MRKFFFLLPFLYGAAPVVALFANNSGQAQFSETLLPLAAVTLATLLLLPVCRLLAGSWLRGAIVLSIFWLILFSYGHVAHIIGRHPIAGHNPANVMFFLPVATGLGLLCLFAVRRSRSEPTTFAGILMVSVGAMLVTSLVTIVRFQSSVRPAPVATALPEERIEASSVLRRPDIYYIILDRYAASRTLASRYHWNNESFLDSLRARGFYIAEESRANYLPTAQSLASSLNMAHILPLGTAIGAQSTDWQPVFDLIAENRLAHFMKAQGYRYIHIGPDWRPTAHNPQADVTFSYGGIPEFSRILLTTTAVYPLLYRMGIDNADREKFEGVKRELGILASLPAQEPSPKFAFVHLLVPHNPYVFSRDGTYRTPQMQGAHPEPENYVEQARFISSRIHEVVARIQGAYPAGEPPVIVIQGDEGPYPARTQPHSFDWTQVTDQELNEKMRILNAIYAPGCESQFYPAMTPVNTFRIVLNHYFGTGLPLLPDRSYTYRDLLHLYEFIEVTGRIDGFRG